MVGGFQSVVHPGGVYGLILVDRVRDESAERHVGGAAQSELGLQRVSRAGQRRGGCGGGDFQGRVIPLGVIYDGRVVVERVVALGYLHRGLEPGHGVFPLQASPHLFQRVEPADTFLEVMVAVFQLVVELCERPLHIAVGERGCGAGEQGYECEQKSRDEFHGDRGGA